MLKLLPIIFLFFLFVFSAQALEVDQLKNAKPDEVATYKTIGAVELKMHIFLPEGHKKTDARPAIVFFFGGGWVSGTPSQFFPQCRYLASRGMVAMSAEYRIKSKHKTTPRECVTDGKSAVRWLRKNAAAWGVDPNKIAAGGGSAGGHVAAATGNCAGFEEKGEDLQVSSKPNALVLFNPVYDNSEGGYGHARVKDYWKEISPMQNLSKESPPTVTFLGTKDNLIPVKTAEEYQKKMESLGVKSVIHLYQDQPHGFFNLSRSVKNFTETLQHMDAFLVEIGYLQKK